jgi:hypothetical protein
MATTIIPAWETLPITVSNQRVLDLATEALAYVQGDCDKSSDIEDNCYYQGGVDALSDLLCAITYPQTEDQARVCEHENVCWLGHECGVCESTGIRWKGLADSNWPMPHDVRPCTEAGEHQANQRHSRDECPAEES